MDQGGTRGCLYHRERLKERFFHHPILRDHDELCPYVMTDELNKDRKGGCGHRENKAEWDSSVVADVLDIVKIRDIKARTTQPIWMNIWVPQSAKAGKYKGTLTVTGKNASPMELQIEVDVLNRTLPAPKDWAFHLDLWQNPYSVARYYQVPLWSKEHFDAMRPIRRCWRTPDSALSPQYHA